ncbi:MAG TPA: fructose-bisphosphate aldolase, partial [Actinomycetales bacterium]|nr:fructose-bisphosphate aldolase [Actinomycetales bacterium]
DLIAAIHEVVPVPLVLHGSSGVSDDGMRAAIAAGITKVNVSTHLNKVATAATRAFLEENPTAVDPRKYLAPGTAAAAAEMGRLLRLYSGASAPPLTPLP